MYEERIATYKKSCKICGAIVWLDQHLEPIKGIRAGMGQVICEKCQNEISTD